MLEALISDKVCKHYLAYILENSYLRNVKKPHANNIEPPLQLSLYGILKHLYPHAEILN